MRYDSSQSTSPCYTALAALQSYRLDSRIPCYYQDDNCEADYNVHVEAPLGVKVMYSVPGLPPLSSAARSYAGLYSVAAGYAHMTHVPVYSLHRTEQQQQRCEQQRHNVAHAISAHADAGGHRVGENEPPMLRAIGCVGNHSAARTSGANVQFSGPVVSAQSERAMVALVGLTDGAHACASSSSLHTHVWQREKDGNAEGGGACTGAPVADGVNNGHSRSDTHDNHHQRMNMSSGNSSHHHTSGSREVNENPKNGFMAKLAELPVIDSDEEDGYGGNDRDGSPARRGSRFGRSGRTAGFGKTAYADMEQEEWECGSLYDEACLRVVDNTCDAKGITRVELLQRLMELVAASRLSRGREHSDCVAWFDMSHTQLGLVETYAANGAASESGSQSHTRERGDGANDSSTSWRRQPWMLSTRSRRTTPWKSLTQKDVRRCSLSFALIAPLLFVPSYPSYRITKLVCQHCNLNDSDAQGLAYILQIKPSSRQVCTITSVDWSFNTLTVLGAEYLKKCLKFNTILTELVLERNPGIPANCNALKVIAQRLRNNAVGKQNCAWYHRRH